jgi:hypothetical protein
MIGFESDEAILQKLRERLRSMTDAELIEFGKTIRGLAEGSTRTSTRLSGNWKKRERSGSGENFNGELSGVTAGLDLLRVTSVVFSPF